MFIVKCTITCIFILVNNFLTININFFIFILYYFKIAFNLAHDIHHRLRLYRKNHAKWILLDTPISDLRNYTYYVKIYNKLL